ncbi:amylosucrase [Blautia massiliensis]|nr:amylosucrase [Blautia massiliensis (ex Durand et al. 2017)]NSL01649.1 amylosucrase [Blautia massiliensis (ex Durand et al. 2017)]
MMLYIDNFAGNIKGVSAKLPYLKECNVNCLHLMPFLDTPKGRSDGGYAVADFSKVRPDLGSMKDLAALADKCHKNGMNLCMDFVMNHTSEDHEWAKKARQGDGEYMSRYFFYNNREIPDEYEKTVPQVFPTTAPGNFTWLPDIGHYVMTTFYPYQWDLNYGNPRVFNEMMYNFLFLANQGMDVIRIDAVPYIWKELGTPCRNLKQVHTIVRMMRMIAEIVCPSVVLLGEVVMEPEKVVPYFGTVEKPECHMLYNVTTMATTWNSIATRDIRLLKKQMDIVNSLPKQYTFLNYLRCHDDIGWGLDFATLKEWGMDEPSHKRYLNDFFTGKHPGSDSRGELYNDDPVTQDARFCGTTASMCGIEAALFEKDNEKLKRGIREDLMLHAYMLTQSGIPMLYSSDEIGRLNDYSYKEDPDKAADSRYIHRGAFQWELAGKRNSKSSVEGQIFQTLSRMEQIRSQESVFDKDCDVYTYDVHDDSILCILRQKGNERFIGIFNFSDSEKTAWMQEEGTFRDLITDQTLELKDVELPAYGFMWCKRM